MNENLLLDKIKQGDRESFKRLFYGHYSSLVAYAMTYLYDEGKSEDIVQDVFLYLWEHASEMDIKISLKAYLYKMTRNRSLNYLRSIKLQVDTEVLDLIASLKIEERQVLSSGDDKGKLARILKISETFPDGMREVFALKYFENLTYSEIAAALNISINTVKTQLKRAKKRLLSEIRPR